MPAHGRFSDHGRKKKKQKLICVFGAGYWFFFNHGESDAKTRSALQKPPGGTTGKRLIMSGLREETTGNCFGVILEGEGY